MVRNRQQYKKLHARGKGINSDVEKFSIKEVGLNEKHYI